MGENENSDSEIELSVVVPVYNEEVLLARSLARVISSLPGVAKEIVLVDDGSTDGTRDWIRDTFVIGGEENWTSIAEGDILIVGERVESSVPVRIFFQEKNEGKGAAVRRGFSETKGSTIVIHDADLEYDPRDWTKMWKLFDDDLADVVFGSRFIGEPDRNQFFLQSLGNRVISILVSLLNDIQLSDVETCYKMFRREVLDGMDLVSNDFGFEVEFATKVAQTKKWRILEIGISYHGRSYEEGKKIDWKDGLKALAYIMKFRFLQ